ARQHRDDGDEHRPDQFAHLHLPLLRLRDWFSVEGTEIQTFAQSFAQTFANSTAQAAAMASAAA
ncbi:hypothetical protein, partial [Variovorax sp. Varisp62]|uniref:hypothetical protein n=1 Tax=Variovorax sp. Varisp62 TaxID=3243049 RepID=UPI0039B5FA3D